MAKDDGTQRRDHWQEVTDRIVSALESGVPPWRKPWDSGAAVPGGPVNAVTGHRYRGINQMLLGSDARTFEMGDPRWCSYQQARERGWQVRKGERASSILFFKRLEVPDANAEGEEERSRVVPVLRVYPVFHASQMDGIPAYVPPTREEVSGDMRNSPPDDMRKGPPFDTEG